MNKRKKLSLIVVLCVAWILPACQPSAASNQTTGEWNPEMVLKTYKVPGGHNHISEVESILTSLLYYTGDKKLGKVEAGPGGQLVVVAPARIHQGIAKLLDDINQLEPSGPPPTIEFTYWFVLGWQSNQPSKTSSFKEIAHALDLLANNQGPMEFRLLEKINVISISGHGTDFSGNLFRVMHTAAENNGKIVAELGIRKRGMKRTDINTRIWIESGKLLVLGESGYHLTGRERAIQSSEFESVKGKPTTLFIIIRAKILK
jgi:hypothetical protein